MDAITFTNPATAAQYEALTDIDHRLHVPKRQGLAGGCFNGMLSDIDPDAAARYVRWGGNLIARKPGTVAGAAPDAGSADESETENS